MHSAYIYMCIMHSKYICMCRMHSTYMGWLQLVGSLKLQISCAEYTLFYRALLQKRPIILRSLVVAATAYEYMCTYSYAAKVARPRNTQDSNSSVYMRTHTHIRACTHTYTPHTRVWHDSFICVTWLIHLCDVHTWHAYVRHTHTHTHTQQSCQMPRASSFVCVTLRIHTCDMTRTYVCHVWHDSYICVPRVTWLVHMCATCDMTRTYVCHVW